MLAVVPDKSEEELLSGLRKLQAKNIVRDIDGKWEITF
jgi:hypothetical protein